MMLRQPMLEERRYVEIVAKGLDRGAQLHSLMGSSWNIAGRCERPVHREIAAMARPHGMKPWEIGVKTRSSDTPKRVMELETRCRKCGPCLRYRAAQWRRRAETELKRSVRTWFVTLTLRPEEHFKALCRASLRLAERGQSFEALTDAEQFAERHREINPELTKWLKRVRKQSGAAIRYLLVAEAHKSGLPHYHLLISESDSARPVRARELQEQWTLGFSNARLVAKSDEANHAFYAAKYLSKSASARVRASKGYGVSDASIPTPPKAIVSPPERREPPMTPPTLHELKKSFLTPLIPMGSGLMPVRAWRGRRRTDQ